MESLENLITDPQPAGTGMWTIQSVTCDVFGCVVRSRRMNPFLVDFLFLPVRCRVQFVSPVSYWRLYDSP